MVLFGVLSGGNNLFGEVLHRYLTQSPWWPETGEDPKLISLADGSAARVSRALNCSSGTDSLLPTCPVDPTNPANEGPLQRTTSFLLLSMPHCRLHQLLLY